MESEKIQQLENSSHFQMSSFLTKLKYVFLVLIANFLFVLFTIKAITVLGKPLFLFDLFTKCYIAEDSCPNDNVTFWLYTRYVKIQSLNQKNNHSAKSS